MTMTDAPTPRTDAVEETVIASSGRIPLGFVRADFARALERALAAKEAELVRLRLPPEDTMSEHPGCVYCMEAGTPVRLGEVCPKCGDRLPTRTEVELRAELAQCRKDA